MARPPRDPSLLSWPLGSAPSGSGGPSSAVGLTSLPIVNSHAQSAAMLAADLKSRRFRTKWQQASYEGPTARKDAESAERSRWLSLLADLLRNTDTPMGRLLRENPTNSQLLGGGRRAGTLRFRVRAIQKFLGWLACRFSSPLETLGGVPCAGP